MKRRTIPRRSSVPDRRQSRTRRVKSSSMGVIVLRITAGVWDRSKMEFLRRHFLTVVSLTPSIRESSVVPRPVLAWIKALWAGVVVAFL
jgi:hypothetical protein